MGTLSLTRTISDRRLRVLRWRTEEHRDSAQITPFGAHPGRAWPSMPRPELAILRQGCDLGSLIEGLAPGQGRACAHPAGLLLSAGGGADAGCRATCQVACCRARWPASAPAPGAPPVPACTARPGVPPIRTLSTTVSAPGDGQELTSRRAGHSGLGGGGRRGVWSFSRRLSAAVRRGRTGSILAASVVPRRRKAPHRPARRAMAATAVLSRRRRRWPAVCRRG
jgi:hypothetical protein